MREVNALDLHRRVRGRRVLEKRARGLLIAVHRFGRCRAATPAEVQWAARMIDALTSFLNTGGLEGQGR